MYFNVNVNVFFKLIKVHLLVSELYIFWDVTLCRQRTDVSEDSNVYIFRDRLTLNMEALRSPRNVGNYLPVEKG